MKLQIIEWLQNTFISWRPIKNIQEISNTKIRMKNDIQDWTFNLQLNLWFSSHKLYQIETYEHFFLKRASLHQFITKKELFVTYGDLLSTKKSHELIKV